MASLFVSTDEATGGTLWGPTAINLILYAFGGVVVYKSLNVSGALHGGEINLAAFADVYELASKYSLLAINYSFLMLALLGQAAFQIRHKSLFGIAGMALGGALSVLYFWSSGYFGVCMLSSIAGGMFGSSLRFGGKRRKSKAPRGEPEEDLHSS
eukprot:CAMPEP_0115859852 /NCGR_PEP_ID=MMETSP0287-20121206/16828_1 /TAXON_ID=412157 /ORGANISM="Chrysochromulina rotalis, Strain UIO044" /LENGTH=154 /DNA_ID=CAMNT_0003314163 /DNA_START=10 /DNA_END=474 /DNA_ORIENTATION=-